MLVRYELPSPTVVAELPLEPLHAINNALAEDGFTNYKGGSYSPWHPGEALKMYGPVKGAFYPRDERDYTTSRPLFESVTHTMDEYAQTCLRGLEAVGQKARIHTPEHTVLDGFRNHASNETYWDREDYYYGPGARLVLSDYDALDVLTGTLKGKPFPRTWLTSTHKILEYSDEEMAEKLGLKIVAIKAGELALVPPHSIARRKGKNQPGSTYIELEYAKPITERRRSISSKIDHLMYQAKFRD
jgi:hypothetical protein